MQYITNIATTFFACMLLLLAGCAHFPLNMSESEWNRLTPEQQLEARERQAVLDQERARQRAIERQEREAKALEAARLQHEQDLADGMIARFDTVCIGGSLCPGDAKEHIYSLRGFVFVDKIVFTAHDAIGEKHGATVAVYADRLLVQDNVDIKRKGRVHTIFVGAVARNIVIRVRRDDEAKITELKVFGERINPGNGTVIIRQPTLKTVQ